MFDTDSISELGNVMVYTSNNSGHSPEQIADMALNKIMSVSDSAPPVIRDKETLTWLLVHPQYAEHLNNKR